MSSVPDYIFDDELKARFFHAVRGPDLPTLERFLTAPVIYPDGSTSRIDPNMREKGTNETALSIASSTRQMAMIDLLLKHGASTDVVSGDWTLFHVAAYRGDAMIVEKFIESGADFEAVKDGMTPIAVAVASNRPEAFYTLMKAGANLDRVCPGGNTLMHLAAERGHADIAQVLFEKGLDPRRKNDKAKSASDVAFDPALRERIKGWQDEWDAKERAAQKKVFDERMIKLDTMRARRKK